MFTMLASWKESLEVSRRLALLTSLISSSPGKAPRGPEELSHFLARRRQIHRAGEGDNSWEAPAHRRGVLGGEPGVYFEELASSGPGPPAPRPSRGLPQRRRQQQRQRQQQRGGAWRSREQLVPARPRARNPRARRRRGPRWTPGGQAAPGRQIENQVHHRHVQRLGGSQLRPVWQGLPSAAHAEPSPQVPQPGEKTPVHLLRQGLQRHLRPEEARPHPHWHSSL
ncbi:PREDICTED: transcription factor Ovo-like 2 isoform X4 [Rhinopithecus bieti]|uniref:transcription factor Ovo-like 2 isoform X4 n=1 Tax=Rhinopithecus bieti TaxID=61621 RepID=UPI00083C070F|nr:PREDICTED: transcription factor Ovo-like 2 isoform X4 [Rhinopithecus bieti]